MTIEELLLLYVLMEVAFPLLIPLSYHLNILLMDQHEKVDFLFVVELFVFLINTRNLSKKERKK